MFAISLLAFISVFSMMGTGALQWRTEHGGNVISKVKSSWGDNVEPNYKTPASMKH